MTLAHSDQDRDTTLTSQRIVSCRNGSFFTAHSSIPLPGDVSILSTSPSGECTVMVKPGTPQTIEIWTPCRKKSHLEIPEDLHGSVLNDGFFGYGFTWSPCGRYAAYSAEVLDLPHVPELVQFACWFRPAFICMLPGIYAR